MYLSAAHEPFLVTGVALALACGLAGTWVSGSPGSARSAASAPAVPVVASTSVYGDLVEQVGGSHVRVVSIISDPAQDPHSYEASTQNRLELSKAKIVVENGGGYDDFVGRMLHSAKNSSPAVIDAVKVAGKTSKAGAELNEHVWYDLPTMGKLADRIAAALAKTDPAHAGAFRDHAETFKARLTVLENKEKQVKAAHGGTAVAVTEPVPLYMTEAMGLRNETPADFSQAVEEGDDVSAQSLQRTLSLFTGKQVKALVYNKQTSGPPTEKVKAAAEEHGIPVVPVTETLPRGEDYIGWMTANIGAVKSALDR
ncbi:metal ABC transporter solute-binding protein, Zn/Mn family [Streptomyces sp. Isolate_219]|uniref:metal ABC transporter solute-binding protein, Zn/Mn family n=1 Tax=Streptomyces sp. Isolate_219 TaxID=2950110 RepID=UPI0021C5B44F|nr:zinc ABC transporter substrate-binding protein [Streptomyces sp. Isolate_219]MCR8574175.1 zinc ABC transporter substrate-binding protein [Streptomyces sp. Isolate_219]